MYRLQAKAVVDELRKLQPTIETTMSVARNLIGFSKFDPKDANETEQGKMMEFFVSSAGQLTEYETLLGSAKGFLKKESGARCGIWSEFGFRLLLLALRGCCRVVVIAVADLDADVVDVGGVDGKRQKKSSGP